MCECVRAVSFGFDPTTSAVICSYLPPRLPPLVTAGEAEALGVGGGDLGFLDELDAFKASGDSAPSNLNATYEFKKGVLK